MRRSIQSYFRGRASESAEGVKPTSVFGSHKCPRGCSQWSSVPLSTQCPRQADKKIISDPKSTRGFSKPTRDLLEIPPHHDSGVLINYVHACFAQISGTQ
eukprot:6457919-Amphidinium_carterae.1